jgi:type IV secretion system protein VirB10
MVDVDFEREAALSAETVTRAGARGSSTGLALLLGGLVVGAMGYAWYLQTHPSARPANTQESFNTARMPQKLEFDAVAAAKPDNRLALAPPVPAPLPPAPTIAAAPPMVMPPDDSEARRLAEAERIRLAEEERLRKEAQARAAAALRSPMLMVDAVTPASPAAANDAGAFKVQGPNEDPNRRFLENASANDVERSRANRIDRTDALIPQGAMIRATLETAVQSDLPGMVRAITTEDVYGFDGRRILLPKATMLTGEYRAILTRGQTRVFMVWTRALRSDGVSLSLGSYGTDALGRSGVTGEVDEHYAERFGAAIVLSIVGGASSFLTGLGQAAQSTTTISGVQTAAQQAQSLSAQTVSQTFADMANSTLKEQMTMPPTINIDQGTPIIVFVRRDLDFSSLYDDPVKEALRQLKHPAAPVAADGAPTTLDALNAPVAMPSTGPVVITGFPPLPTKK